MTASESTQQATGGTGTTNSQAPTSQSVPEAHQIGQRTTPSKPVPVAVAPSSHNPPSIAALPTQQQPPPQPVTVYAPNGIGIGGNNYGNPTVNNFGEPERKIDSKYVSEITPILAANPGTASILSNSNSDELTQQLYKIFVDAKWLPISIGSVMAGQSLPDGVIVIWRGPIGIPGTQVRVPDDRPDVRAIVYALSNSGIKRLTVAPNPDTPEHEISIEIGGIPK